MKAIPAARTRSRTEPGREVAGTPLTRADRDGVAVLTLTRSEKRNALSDATLEALDDALAAIAQDGAVRAVVVASEGPVFSAGHDLKQLDAGRSDADGGRAYFEGVFSHCSAVMQRLAALPQPTIAAVEGLATAAGCQLVATCDLVVAGENARFQTPGVNIGLFCSTPMVALTRAVAPRHAMEMLLTGDPIDARTALAIGLVNRIAPAGETLTHAIALAERIASRAPRSIRLGKKLFRRQASLPLDEAYRLCSAAMVENLLTPEAEEGIAAVFEKRAPVWPQD